MLDLILSKCHDSSYASTRVYWRKCGERTLEEELSCEESLAWGRETRSDEQPLWRPWLAANPETRYLGLSAKGAVSESIACKPSTVSGNQRIGVRLTMSVLWVVRLRCYHTQQNLKNQANAQGGMKGLLVDFTAHVGPRKSGQEAECGKSSFPKRPSDAESMLFAPLGPASTLSPASIGAHNSSVGAARRSNDIQIGKLWTPSHFWA